MGIYSLVGKTGKETSSVRSIVTGQTPCEHRGIVTNPALEGKGRLPQRSWLSLDLKKETNISQEKSSGESRR